MVVSIVFVVLCLTSMLVLIGDSVMIVTRDAQFMFDVKDKPDWLAIAGHILAFICLAMFVALVLLHKIEISPTTTGLITLTALASATDVLVHKEADNNN